MADGAGCYNVLNVSLLEVDLLDLGGVVLGESCHLSVDEIYLLLGSVAIRDV